LFEPFKEIFLKVVECPVADQLPPPPLTKKERQEKKGKVNI
jgi:hypothetical protein